MKSLLLVTAILVLFVQVSARNGMWMPQYLDTWNETEMQAMGSKLKASDIYSEEHPSLKDAVVHFGGGCTGEVVSADGLLFTNHHCGYSQIQSLSTLGNNYLKNGFWAESQENELPCPGLVISFVREMREVTGLILSQIPDDISGKDRENRIKILSDSLEKKFSSGDSIKASIQSFYQGNAYYLNIMEVFHDIRLVGTPPESIGNFGGETDNWIWPRHTGDFSIFRIYASRENKPAAYSRDNVPYHPRQFFSIRTSGIKEGDFTLVYGFPGTTQYYQFASVLEDMISDSYPVKIALRNARLEILRKSMAENDTIRLKYASKFRRLANYYKRWKGELSGLTEYHAPDTLKLRELAFEAWAEKNPVSSSRYGGIIPAVSATVANLGKYSLANDYFTEGLRGIELLSLVSPVIKFIGKNRLPDPDSAGSSDEQQKVLNAINGFYKNYDVHVDRMNCREMIQIVIRGLPDEMIPEILKKADSLYNGNTGNYVSDLFAGSVFLERDKLKEMLHRETGMDSIKNDPAVLLYRSVQNTWENVVRPGYETYRNSMDSLKRIYMKGILEMHAGEAVFPDANSTLRVSYGKVRSMKPRDGILYEWYTTTAGILEKGLTGNEDYTVPAVLRSAISDPDNLYAEKGLQHVCFMADNHTTGGNSGSPVLDGNGNLIGINFDRAWEGVMSDILFQPLKSRNIIVDIRYVLFIMKKVGKADRLIKELRLVP
ncbi:MAG: S46 family peptidase [Bacteroidia bacterium]|nr:S46 family peptidase [Bacteroidia bacterium]